ncbi:MAG: hypothetical protein ACI906_000592 [Candidatus Latescibacterota bacterium]|jgi:hypothetical protein
MVFMNVGNTQSQSIVASIQVSRSTFEMKQTTTNANGDTQAKSLLVDAVQVNIQIDSEFANRVLNDSLEEKLNSMFQEAGMDTSVDSLLQGGGDFSPTATAQRIVDFATGFFGQFQNNNVDKGGPEQLDGFATLIKGAIEEGFASAKDILEGLGEIASGIREDIDETFGLTMKGIDDFVVEQAQSLSTPAEDETAAAI